MADQFELFTIGNPCQGICQTDHRGFCSGCLRSRDERFHWQTYSDMQKRNVLRLCQQRRRRKGQIKQTDDLLARGDDQLTLF